MTPLHLQMLAHNGEHTATVLPWLFCEVLSCDFSCTWNEQEVRTTLTTHANMFGIYPNPNSQMDNPLHAHALQRCANSLPISMCNRASLQQGVIHRAHTRGCFISQPHSNVRTPVHTIDTLTPFSNNNG